MIRVRMAGFILKDMVTAGNMTRAFRTTHGIPKGAKFIKAEYDEGVDILNLWFEEPEAVVVDQKYDLVNNEGETEIEITCESLPAGNAG